MKVYKNKLLPRHVRNLMQKSVRLAKRKSRAVFHDCFWRLAHEVIDGQAIIILFHSFLFHLGDH